MSLNMSIIRRTRKQKLAALAAGLAISIAKEKKDPAWEKHRYLKEKFVQVKQAIFRKYRMQAIRLARQKFRSQMQSGQAFQNNTAPPKVNVHKKGVSFNS